MPKAVILNGAEAIAFAKENLKQVRTNPDRWEVEYVNENDGSRWILDYPNSGHHGGGRPRIRKIS